MRAMRGLGLALAAAALGRCAVGEEQTTRLRITNGCRDEAMWIAHEESGESADPQNVMIAPGESYDFQVFDGLAGTRYWPKMRCDEDGTKCTIGESGGPGQTCSEKGCAPPVDTKFEASFGQSGIDWVDMSLVDGYTLPFKLEMKGSGECTAGVGDRVPSKVIDCSALSFGDCPGGEDLGAAGSSASLQVVNPDTEEVVGCYSPCSKLTLNHWGNLEAEGRGPWDAEVVPYCCPTPPESPHDCRAGPVRDTNFVKSVHRMCPGVYGYSYDDGMGLLQCPDDTKYEVTFYCPGEDEGGTRKSTSDRSRAAEGSASSRELVLVEREGSAFQGRVGGRSAHRLAEPLPMEQKEEAPGADSVLEPAEPPPRQMLVEVEVEAMDCPQGYEKLDRDLDGEGKTWTPSLPTIIDCAQECNVRAGCSGFEFHPGTHYARREGESTTTCGTYTGGESNIQGVMQFGGWISCRKAAIEVEAMADLPADEMQAVKTPAEPQLSVVQLRGLLSPTYGEQGFWQVIASDGARVFKDKESKEQLQRKPEGAVLRGLLNGRWIALRDEPGFVQAPRNKSKSPSLKQVHPQVWRVTKRYATIKEKKDVTSKELGMKPMGDVFKGFREGFWIAPLGEPGFVLASLDGAPLVEELQADPPKKWLVVAEQGARVRRRKAPWSTVIGSKDLGDVVQGWDEGSWLRLDNEAGFIIFSNGSSTLLREMEAGEAEKKEVSDTLVMRKDQILKAAPLRGRLVGGVASQLALTTSALLYAVACVALVATAWISLARRSASHDSLARADGPFASRWSPVLLSPCPARPSP